MIGGSDDSACTTQSLTSASLGGNIWRVCFQEIIIRHAGNDEKYHLEMCVISSLVHFVRQIVQNVNPHFDGDGQDGQDGQDHVLLALQTLLLIFLDCIPCVVNPQIGQCQKLIGLLIRYIGVPPTYFGDLPITLHYWNGHK